MTSSIIIISQILIYVYVFENLNIILILYFQF